MFDTASNRRALIRRELIGEKRSGFRRSGPLDRLRGRARPLAAPEWQVRALVSIALPNAWPADGSARMDGRAALAWSWQEVLQAWRPSFARRDGVARRRPVGDLLTEQAADQLDCRARGPTAFVQKRIELNDVDRSDDAGIVQQLHDQVRLAIGGTTRHGGADARRHGRIEEIDIEADMQHAIARLDAFDDAADQDGDAELVDLAHVDDPDPARAHQLLFELVDRTRAEQIEFVRENRSARIVAEQAVEPGLAAQERG